jgi:hypothetical protein
MLLCMGLISIFLFWLCHAVVPASAPDLSPLALMMREGIRFTAKTRVLTAAMSAIALTLGSRLGGRDDVEDLTY